MKCPKCGNELRISKKDPSYGLCDNCKKRYHLPERLRKNDSERPQREGSSNAAARNRSKEQQDDLFLSNIPPKHIRDKREREMKSNYDAMLSAGSEDSRSTEPEEKARFLAARILCTLASVALFGIVCFQAFSNGLQNTVNGNVDYSGTAGVALATCYLIAGMVNICMRNRNSAPAFFLPALLYIGGGVVGMLNLGIFKTLIIWSYTGFVLAAVNIVLFIIIQIQKRTVHA